MSLSDCVLLSMAMRVMIPQLAKYLSRSHGTGLGFFRLFLRMSD